MVMQGDYLKIVGYNNAGKCTIDNDWSIHNDPV